jgi:hypothetical protein
MPKILKYSGIVSNHNHSNLICKKQNCIGPMPVTASGKSCSSQMIQLVFSSHIDQLA